MPGANYQLKSSENTEEWAVEPGNIGRNADRLVFKDIILCSTLWILLLTYDPYNKENQRSNSFGHGLKKAQ